MMVESRNAASILTRICMQTVKAENTHRLGIYHSTAGLQFY